MQLSVYLALKSRIFTQNQSSLILPLSLSSYFLSFSLSLNRKMRKQSTNRDKIERENMHIILILANRIVQASINLRKLV